MISPVAAALFASPLYPKTVNNNLTNNAIQLTSQAFNSDQGDAKVDYRLSSKDMISGRFTRAFQIDPTRGRSPIWKRRSDGARLERCWRLDAILQKQPHQRCSLWMESDHCNTGTTFDKTVGAFGESVGISGSNPAGIIGLLGVDFGGGLPLARVTERYQYR